MQAALGIHVVIFIDSIGMRERHDMNGERSLFPSSEWHKIFLLYAPFNMAELYFIDDTNSNAQQSLFLCSLL